MTSGRRTCLWAWALAIACAIDVAGCGGGGGGGGDSSSSPAAVSPATAANVLPIIVDAGPANDVNTPFVSVTICTPGSANCQTIDHVLLDTGSTGLRIISSVLSPSLALTQQTAGNGSPLAECVQFADGSFIWGPVKAAGVTLGGESLNSLAIQVIGDPAFTIVPASCSTNGGQAQNTVQAFGANGILGVAVFQQDCGAACAQAAPTGAYYACAGASCQAVAVSLASQIQNPVGLLASDNNGVVINLPAVAATGAATVAGSLILGIGTQSNNSLGNAVVYAVDPNAGTLTTVFNGRRYSGSVLDTGSNALYFPDSATPICSSGFYCPVSLQQLSATNQGTNGSSGTVNFSVANADNLLSTSFTAFSNLAGPSTGTPGFDWGLPFYFGRTVFTAIENKSSAGGNGPYVAY